MESRNQSAASAGNESHRSDPGGGYGNVRTFFKIRIPLRICIRNCTLKNVYALQSERDFYIDKLFSLMSFFYAVV